MEEVRAYLLGSEISKRVQAAQTVSQIVWVGNGSGCLVFNASAFNYLKTVVGNPI